MRIGEKIKASRKAIGLTQQELGGEHFTKGYISQIENGTVEPSMKVLQLIADKLQKPVAYFLEEDSYYRELESKFAKGENLYYKNNYMEAKELFNDIVEQLSGSIGVIYGNSLLYLGKCLYCLKEYEESLKILNNSVEQLSELMLYEKLVDAYNYIGANYFTAKQYCKAIDIFEKGLRFIDEKALALPSITARFMLNTATSYMNIGRLSKALGVFEQNITFCKKELVMDTLLDCYVRVAYIYYRLDRINEAKKNIVKANSINCVLEYDMLWTEIYNVLGMIVHKEGSSEKGINLLNKSLEICRKMEYHWGFYVNITDLIRIFLDTGKLGEAEELVTKYYEKIRSLQDDKVLYILIGECARLQRLKNDIGKGIELYKEAIDNFARVGMRWEGYHYSKELADVLIDIQPSEAKKYYNMSLAFLSEVNS